MNRKLLSLIVLLTLALSTLACLPCGLLGGKKAAQPTPAETSGPAAAATAALPRPTTPPEPTATPEPTPAPAVGLGEEYRSEIGRYSFRQVPGYELTESEGFVVMIASGGNPQNGPMLILLGQTLDSETTLDEFYGSEVGKVDQEGLELSPPRDHQVAGAPARSVDVSGTQDGVPVAGRITIVMVTPRQVFMMGGMAPPDRWEGELEPLFEAVLASVSFLEPGAAEGPPTAAEPSAAAEEEEPASGGPSSMSNLTSLPLLDDAEEVYCMDEYNLNYWTRVDLVTALAFYRQELPALGWQLDYQDGKCLDDRKLTRRCMGWHGNYDNPEESPLFFLRGDGEYLTLNAIEEGGRVNIIISINPDVYAD